MNKDEIKKNFLKTFFSKDKKLNYFRKRKRPIRIDVPLA